MKRTIPTINGAVDVAPGLSSAHRTLGAISSAVPTEWGDTRLEFQCSASEVEAEDQKFQGHLLHGEFGLLQEILSQKKEKKILIILF